jgi:uncharacterized protein YggE
MLHLLRYALLATLTGALVCPTARAQESGATISGRGVATIKRPASKMRLAIVLSARGKTLEEALAALKDRRTAAAAQLKKLKADEASVKFDETAIAAGEGAGDINSIMRAQLARSGGRVPKGLQLPQVVHVSCNLTAEWPLQYKTQEELLAITSELQQQIKEADLAGLNEPKNLTPEEQELEAELAEAANDYGGRQEAKPGEPSFTFVAEITEQDRAAALAEAFATAKTDASRLAKAAGLALGGLVELSGEASPALDDYGPYAAYRRQLGGAGANPDEAIAHIPGPVSLQTHVEAKFRAK